MSAVRVVVQRLKELVESFSSLFYILVFSKPSKLPRSSRKECAILGNGPSLSKDVTGRQDIGDHTDVMCVNNFFIHRQQFCFLAVFLLPDAT